MKSAGGGRLTDIDEDLLDRFGFINEGNQLHFAFTLRTNLNIGFGPLCRDLHSDPYA